MRHQKLRGRRGKYVWHVEKVQRSQPETRAAETARFAVLSGQNRNENGIAVHVHIFHDFAVGINDLMRPGFRPQAALVIIAEGLE